MLSHSLFNDCFQSVLTFGLPWPGPETWEPGAREGTACPGEVVSVFQATASGNAGTFLQAFPIVMAQEITIPHGFSPWDPGWSSPWWTILSGWSLLLYLLVRQGQIYLISCHFSLFFIFLAESATFLQWTLVLGKPHLNAIIATYWA